MRKVLIWAGVVSMLLLMTSVVQAEGVPLTPDVFPDEALRSYLAEEADGNHNEMLDENEISSITALYISSRGIASLDGTEYLTSLKTLDCSQNPLDRIPAEKWPQLVELYCANLSLQTLDVSGLPELDTLNCCYNSLTALDVSANTKLEYLAVDNNPLTVLDVSRNTELLSIGCGGTGITAMNLSGHTKLERLSAERSRLSSLNLSGCIALKQLNCREVNLTELDLSDCVKLEEIYIESNDLTKLDFQNCPEILEIYCNDNRLTELNVSSCPELLILHCGGNCLTQVDVSRCPKLKELWVEAMTGLKSIDLRNNANLETFFCYWNDVSELDFSGNPKLQLVWIDGNHLTHFDLSGTSVDPEDSHLDGNAYDATGSGNTLDLSTLPGFDVSRASNWSGGTVNGTVLTMTKNEVTYLYDCGRNIHVQFTIRKSHMADGLTYVPLNSRTARITGCSLTGDIVIPEKLDGYQITDLASGLFFYKRGITSVTLPATVTRFGGNPETASSVFEGCRDLEAVHVDPKNPAFSSENGILYSKDRSVMLLYPSGREETEVVFPVRVTRFAFNSFYEITKSKRIFVENPDASWDFCFTILRDAVLYYRTGGLTEKIVQQIIREEGYEPRTYHPEYIALEGGNAGENAEAIADRIIRELITGGMSPAEKARVLHDWITAHARYSMKYDSPTGVLKYGEGHCESYATAYQMLLDKAGVENKLAMGSAGESRGTAEGHMWNLVRIGSVWLHVDCTWDDPVNPDGSSPEAACSGMERDDYFLVPSKEICRDHFWDGCEEELTGWIAAEGGTAFLNQDGERITGWQVIRGQTFYFDESGISVTGNMILDGISYEFDAVCVLKDAEGDHYAGALLILELPKTFSGILRMPEALTAVEAEAFAGTNAEAYFLGEKITSIGPRAFADLKRKAYIFLSDSLTEVDPTAFDNSSVIFVSDGRLPECMNTWLSQHPGYHVIYR